jgi:hypothetical protein
MRTYTTKAVDVVSLSKILTIAEDPVSRFAGGMVEGQLVEFWVKRPNFFRLLNIVVRVMRDHNY